MSINPFHQLAHQWWDQDGPFHTLHDINPCRLSYIQSFVDLKQNRVMDLGCGGGILSESLAQAGAEVVGVDIEQRLIDVAKHHAESMNLSIDYRALNVENIESEHFDVIVCMEMLEHVAEPREILSHCHRLLKSGGYLFLSTINRSLKAYFELILMGEYVLGLLPRQTHDYHLFIKPSELMESLQTLGFELLDLKGMRYQPWSRKTALCQAVDVNYLLCAKKL